MNDALADLQTLFWNAARSDPAPAAVDEAFVSRGALNAQQRLGLYRTAYWVRQVNALRELFPAVVAHLGDGPFARAASRCVGKHPSTAHALEHLAGPFAGFLLKTEGPVVGGVAAVERARFEALIAPDGPVVAFAEVDPATFAASSLQLGAHLRVVTCPEASLALLHDAPPPPTAPTDALAVWREGFVVFQRYVPQAEAAAIASAKDGASVASLCEALAEGGLGPPEVFAALGAWFHRGWVSALHPLTSRSAS